MSDNQAKRGTRTKITNYERKRQKGEVLLQHFKSTVGDLLREPGSTFVEGSPTAVPAAGKLLRETVGKLWSDTAKALQQKQTMGALPHPPTRLAAGETHAPDHPQYRRRPAHGPPHGMASEMDATMNDVLKQNPAKFERLYKLMGSPSPTEQAALFLNPAMWGALPEAGERGQASVLSGLLFERMSQFSPEFRAATVEADRARQAFNAEALKQRLAGLSPEAAKAAAAEFAKHSEFGPAVFDAKVLDGNKKQLTDGMRVSWSGDLELLVTTAQEAKSGKRGQKEAFRQLLYAIRRMRKTGVIVGGCQVAPEHIHFVPRPGTPAGPALVGYYQGAASGVETRPGPYTMDVVGVHAPGLRDFATAWLKAWNKRVKAAK